MMQDLQLVASASATFDNGGNASVVLGPNAPGEIWQVQTTGVNSSSSATTAATIYRGSPSPLTQIDHTAVQGNGASSDTQYYLHSGEFITVVWSGGTPGANATAVVQGTKSLPGRGY